MKSVTKVSITYSEPDGSIAEEARKYILVTDSGDLHICGFLQSEIPTLISHLAQVAVSQAIMAEYTYRTEDQSGDSFADVEADSKDIARTPVIFSGPFDGMQQ